jgi:hypothetical protein
MCFDAITCCTAAEPYDAAGDAADDARPSSSRHDDQQQPSAESHAGCSARHARAAANYDAEHERPCYYERCHADAAEHCAAAGELAYINSSITILFVNIHTLHPDVLTYLCKARYSACSCSDMHSFSVAVLALLVVDIA